MKPTIALLASFISASVGSRASRAPHRPSRAPPDRDELRRRSVCGRTSGFRRSGDRRPGDFLRIITQDRAERIQLITDLQRAVDVWRARSNVDSAWRVAVDSVTPDRT
jgi:hypothetical protein